VTISIVTAHWLGPSWPEVRSGNCQSSCANASQNPLTLSAERSVTALTA